MSAVRGVTVTMPVPTPEEAIKSATEAAGRVRASLRAIAKANEWAAKFVPQAEGNSPLPPGMAR